MNWRGRELFMREHEGERERERERERVREREREREREKRMCVEFSNILIQIFTSKIRSIGQH